MSSFLMGGRENAESLSILFADARKELRNILENPPQMVNVSMRTTLAKTVAAVAAAHRVSRADLTMLDSHFPETIKNLPLTVWTADPSSTGYDLAMEAFDKAIKSIDKMNVAQALDYVIKGLEDEISQLADVGAVYHNGILQGIEGAAQCVQAMTELNRQGTGFDVKLNTAFEKLMKKTSDSDEKAVVDRFKKSRNGWTRHLTERGAADARVLDINALMFSSYAILDRMIGVAAGSAQLKEGDIPAWDEQINLYVERRDSIAAIPNFSELPFYNVGEDGTVDTYFARVDELSQPAEYDYQNGFMQAVRDYQEWILPAIYASAQKAEVYIVGRNQQLRDALDSLKLYRDLLSKDSIPSGGQEFFINGNGQKVEERFEHLVVVMRDLALAQRVRTGLLDFFFAEFQAVVEHGLAQVGMLKEATAEAQELALESFWDDFDAEQLALDGLVQEGAWEAFRRGLEYLLNALSKIMNYFLNKIDGALTKRSINDAKNNSVELPKLDGNAFDERARKRLGRMYTVGVKDISKYAGLGNIWSDSYRQTVLGVQGPISTLSSLFGRASRGEELEQKDIDQLREQLNVVIDKANFKRLPDIATDLALENIATRVQEVRSAVKEAFQKESGQDPDLGTLKTANDNILKFLEGPASTMYKSINAAEMKNIITKLNSMDRQAAGNANNKSLQKLVPFFDAMRNLIQAAASMVGIGDEIARQTGRFVTDLGFLIKPKTEKTTGDVATLKQESFEQETVPDYLLQPLPSLYLAQSESLAYGGFTAPRGQRFSEYRQAIANSIHRLRDAQFRRATMQTRLAGITVGALDDVTPWTLGLDTGAQSDALLNAILTSLELFQKRPLLDDNGQTNALWECLAPLDPNNVCQFADPNLEVEGSWVGYYRKLSKEAVEQHTDFTTPETRVAAVSAFAQAQPPFAEPGELTLTFENIPVPNVDAESIDRFQQYATLVVTAMDAYAQLRYGSDHLLFSCCIANQA